MSVIVVIANVSDFNAASYDVVYDSSVLAVLSGNVEGTLVTVSYGIDEPNGVASIVNEVSGLTGALGSGHLAVEHQRQWDTYENREPKSWGWRELLD